MTGLVLALWVHAAPPALDLVERNSLGVTAMEAARTREQLKHLLARAGFSVSMTGEVCGDSACLRALARGRGHVVVGVTLVKSKKAVSVDLEAVDGARVVLQQTFLAAGGELARSPEAQTFAATLAERLGVRPVDEVKPDAPVAEVKELKKELVPAEPPPDRPWVEQQPARSNVGPKVVLVSSGVVAAAGVVLLVVGAVSAGALAQRLEVQLVVGLSRAEAQQQADGANALMGAGAAAVVVGAAGVVTSVVLLSTAEAEPAVDVE